MSREKKTVVIISIPVGLGLAVPVANIDLPGALSIALFVTTLAATVAASAILVAISREMTRAIYEATATASVGAIVAITRVLRRQPTELSFTIHKRRRDAGGAESETSTTLTVKAGAEIERIMKAMPAELLRQFPDARDTAIDCAQDPEVWDATYVRRNLWHAVVALIRRTWKLLPVVGERRTPPS